MSEKNAKKNSSKKSKKPTSRSGYSDRELMFTVDPYIKGDFAVIRQVQQERAAAAAEQAATGDAHEDRARGQ